MFDKRLSLTDLDIRPDHVYEQMGYGMTTPDERTVSVVERLLADASKLARPNYCYAVMYGSLEGDALTMSDHVFHLGRIISRQLAGAEAYAIFIATVGWKYENWRKEGDLLNAYIADALGSVIAERCADRMEADLQASIEKLGWRRTNRFSPGYCEWHVSEQQLLIPLFGNPNPCGVTLTESSLMQPVKSVSGIIGLGRDVSYRDYSCQLCQLSHCFRRKH